MFEKESKEYANKWLEHVKDLELEHKTDDKPEYIRIKEAYQKGAEYGYNLAKEEMDYLNQHWKSEEERKANEWNYVKDGYFPVYTDGVLVYLNSGEIVIDYYHDITGWKNSFNEDVIAWKEIVLPKESE